MSTSTTKRTRSSTAAKVAAPDSQTTALPSPNDSNTLYLLDLSGYVFRAYHAVAPLSNSKGEPTHAVLGTTHMIKRLIEERKPAYLAIAMDSKTPSFRRDLDVRYKANRPEPPPDLHLQMTRCEQIARAYKIPIFQRDGFEADDWIASLVHTIQAKEPTLSIVIVSADKDLMQLVNERTVLWDTMRNKVYGPNEVMEKLGVLPNRVQDLLALTGDSSDNIPGVPTVGPKTAADLLNQFGSFENIYQHVHEISRAKLKQTLLEHEAEARLSHTLVELKSDLTPDVTLEALRYSSLNEHDTLALRTLFNELEFGRLANAIEITTPQSRMYRSITTAVELEQFVKHIYDVVGKNSTAMLAFDTESTSLRPMDAILVGLSVAIEPGEAVYIPIAHRYLGVPEQIPLEVVRSILAPLFADAKVQKCAHNLKFDAEMLRLAGMPVSNVVFDTMLAHYLLDPDAPHGLKELAESELGIHMTSYEQLVHKKAGKKNVALSMDQVPIEEAAPYAAADADCTLELALRFVPRIEAAGLRSILRDIEIPLTSVLATMERTGILIDTTVLQRLSHDVETQLREIETQAHALLREAGLSEAEVAQFNIGSPKQLETVLFDTLKLPVIKRTKTGRSTDAEVLEELSDQHRLPHVILDYRSLSKLRGTYLDALPKLVSPKTGRVHTSYQQHGAATGRISSTDPNLQNIPIRTELGRKIREAFVAPNGYFIMSADYSQIELRILAALSQDPILIEAFRNHEDIHARTARELFLPSESKEEPTREMRRRAKGINFGILYGQGAPALAKTLDVSRDEAEQFIHRYFERYAGVKAYLNQQIETARRGEGVRTFFGRRRFLNDIHSANRALRLAAERVAQNTPIQGTAADLIKMAMVALQEPPTPHCRMLLTVHDELVFEVLESEVELAAEKVRLVMQNIVSLAVPLIVEVGWGRHWGSAHH